MKEKEKTENAYKYSLIAYKDEWAEFQKNNMNGSNYIMNEKMYDYFFSSLSPAVKEIKVNLVDNKLDIVDDKGEKVSFSAKEMFLVHQKMVKEEASCRLNGNFARTFIDNIVAKDKEIVIGLVINLPKGIKYDTDGVINEKGMYQTYQDTLKNVNVINYPNGVCYGVVMAVGKSVDIELEKGDKVLLRTMPTNKFFYGGEVYVHITEYDISAVLKMEGEIDFNSL